MSGDCLSPASRIRIAADIHRHSTSDDDSGCVLEEYSWIPSGIKPDMVHMYFACLPEDKIPYVNSSGEEWRVRQLQYQLPPQDSDARYCGKISLEEERELVQFEAGRKRECLGRGIIEQLPYDSKRRHCHQCKGSLREGNLVVCAERLGKDVHWHPQCFVCTDCSNLLVDLIYFKHGADVFCGRHHAEQIKPRCAKCDELIFSEECTEAEGHTWHMTHFACAECGTQLGGQRYIAKNDRIMCVPCYHRNFSLVCNTCRKEIVIEKTYVTQNDSHWHADERCFCCCDCKKNLLGKRYTFYHGKLYCGDNVCYTKCLPKVSFDARLAVESTGRRGSLPQPPIRNPPPPPSENIYETVLPCTSREADEIEHTRSSSGCSRRSQSADVRRVWGDTHCEKCRKGYDQYSKKQNYYSKMPPPSPSERHKQRRCSSCSSSDSDNDDVFLSNYLAASLSRFKTSKGTKQRRGECKPVISTVRTARNKSSSNCIVS